MADETGSEAGSVIERDEFDKEQTGQCALICFNCLTKLVSVLITLFYQFLFCYM